MHLRAKARESHIQGHLKLHSKFQVKKTRRRRRKRRNRRRKRNNGRRRKRKRRRFSKLRRNSLKI